MAGAWVCMAAEELPNAEGGTNMRSSNVFYLKADSVKFDEGLTLLEEKGKTVGVLGRAKHLGVAKYEPKMTVSGVFPRPSDLGLFLLLFAGDVTKTPGGAAVTDPDSAAVPAGCTKWVYNFAEDTPKTAQIIAKDAGGKFWKLTGAGLSSIAFKFGDDGVLGCDLELVGLFGGEIEDPSLTPTFDAATPFRQGDMTLEWLTESAVTKGFDFTLAAGLETDKGFSVVSDYPDTIQFGNDEDSLPSVAGTIDKRTVATVDLNALHEGGQFAAVIKLTHREKIGQTGRTSAMWIEMPGCQHVSWDPDDIANVRRRETRFGWEARVDEATHTLCTITLVNATSAYETYGG